MESDMQIFDNRKTLKCVSYHDFTHEAIGPVKIAEDYECNPIPRINEMVIFSGNVYKVAGVIYDYDKEVVIVMLKFIRETARHKETDEEE